MYSLPPMDDDERTLFNAMIAHFVTALNAERGRNADLQRRLDCAEARLKFFDAAHYGIV
jgi:hypothetical protein